MESSFRLRVLAVVMASLTLLLVPTVAMAYTPTEDDTFVCTEQDDGTVDCVAGTFEENCDGTFEVTDEDGNVIDSGDVQGDDEGQVDFTFDPDGNDLDDLTVTVTCGDGENTKVLSDTLENVLAAPDDSDDDDDDAGVVDDDDLAQTGADTATVLTVALGALALGGLVLGISRRRGPEPA